MSETMTDPMAYQSPRYLTCAETAKLLRKALKAAFPGVKFSVRSDTYTGGASIRVRWTDGPRAKAVDRVAQQFNGADFDGMIDLKTYNNHWLYPDGTVSIARAEGTQGSRGYLPEVLGDPQGPTAELVSLGANFVFTNRDLSPEFTAEIEAEIAKANGGEYKPNDYYDQPVKIHDHDDYQEWGPSYTRSGWGTDLVWQISGGRDR